RSKMGVSAWPARTYCLKFSSVSGALSAKSSGVMTPKLVCSLTMPLLLGLVQVMDSDRRCQCYRLGRIQASMSLGYDGRLFWPDGFRRRRPSADHHRRVPYIAQDEPRNIYEQTGNHATHPFSAPDHSG